MSAAFDRIAHNIVIGTKRNKVLKLALRARKDNIKLDLTCWQSITILYDIETRSDLWVLISAI